MRSLSIVLTGAVVLLVGVLGLAGCDASTTPPEAEPLTFTVSQRDTLDQPITDLGTYTVPLGEAPALDGPLTQSITLNGDRGAWTAQRVGGDPAKDVIVFLVSRDGTVDGKAFSSSATRPVAVDEPRDAEPTAARTVFQGTFYAFFVDGIGDTPDVPVEMTLRGSGDAAARTITVDPAQHTLPNDAVFQVSDADAALAPTDAPSFLNVAFESGNRGGDMRTAGGVYPLYVLETTDVIATGSAADASGVGIQIPQSPAPFAVSLLQVR